MIPVQAKVPERRIKENSKPFFILYTFFKNPVYRTYSVPVTILKVPQILIHVEKKKKKTLRSRKYPYPFYTDEASSQRG